MKSLPSSRVLLRGKATPKVALLHPHKAPKEVKQIFETIENRDERVEFNRVTSPAWTRTTIDPACR